MANQLFSLLVSRSVPVYFRTLRETVIRNVVEFAGPTAQGVSDLVVAMFAMLYDPAMLCDPAMWTLLYPFFYLRRRPGGGLGRKYAR